MKLSVYVEKFRRARAKSRARRMSEEVGGHSPKRQTVDIKQVVSRLPKGPAPGAAKKEAGT